MTTFRTIELENKYSPTFFKKISVSIEREEMEEGLKVLEEAIQSVTEE